MTDPTKNIPWPKNPPPPSKKLITIDEVKQIAFIMYDEGYSDSMRLGCHDPNQWWCEIERGLIEKLFGMQPI